MGVLDALAEAGLSVPGDISVAGYDNTTFAAFGPISLTSVDQAGHQIGANAARLLLDRIADRQPSTAQVKLSPTLVPRRSTAAPRGLTQRTPVERRISVYARLLAELTLEEKASLCLGSDFWHTAPVPRLGIPAITALRRPARAARHRGGE